MFCMLRIMSVGKWAICIHVVSYASGGTCNKMGPPLTETGVG